MTKKGENIQLIREASVVSVVAFGATIAISAGMYLFGKKVGTLEGDKVGFERGAVAQFQHERKLDLEEKKMIGFVLEPPMLPFVEEEVEEYDEEEMDDRPWTEEDGHEEDY